MKCWFRHGAAFFLLGMIFIAIFAPLIAPYHPMATDHQSILSSPDRHHFLGTDDVGRDVLTHLLWGSRVSLAVGLFSVSIAIFIGIVFGGIAGFYGGVIDLFISRVIEIFSCFPVFFLILALLAFVGPSLMNIMIVIGCTSWPGIARLVRAEFLRLREEEFVKGAWALGARPMRIIFRHLLPNVLQPLFVIAAFGIAAAILTEASLSFLGFGVRPEDPSWGSLLASGEAYWDVAWWLTLPPGFAIFLTVTAFHLLGESFRKR